MKAQYQWQDAAGQRWVALQTRTDAHLGPLGQHALALVAPAHGERALDVGCGAGQTTLELSDLVGPGGSVVGVDVSEPLLEAARERTRGRANVELRLGNAATERYERPFDLMFSRFGVMFFEDAVAAFANLRAALVPGGRLCFVCWQAREANPWAHEPLERVRKLRPDAPVPAMLEPGQPGPFYFADSGFVQRTLTDAGFRQVETTPHEEAIAFGGARTLEEAIDYALQIGPTSRFVNETELGGDPRVKELVAETLAPYVSPSGVLIPTRTWLVSARA